MSPNSLLAAGLGLCAAVVVVVLVAARFLKTEPPPPPPPPPPSTAGTVTGQLRYTEGFYKASLEDDFKRFGLPSVDVAALAQPLVYAEELTTTRRMKPEKDTIETPHLKLATHTVKEWAMTADGQGYRFEHILLTITNKSARPLAYRVDTAIEHPEKCKSKGSIPHNAIAIAPGETLRRTECLWRPGALLDVRGIEVVELNDLAYYYVSRLEPSQVLLDERTAAGHTPPKGKTCNFVPWREIQTAASAGQTTWADVMDFYARHNCDEYSYWRGYKRWTSPGKLPSHAPSGEPAPAPAPAPTPAPAK